MSIFRPSGSDKAVTLEQLNKILDSYATLDLLATKVSKNGDTIFGDLTLESNLILPNFSPTGSAGVNADHELVNDANSGGYVTQDELTTQLSTKADLSNPNFIGTIHAPSAYFDSLKLNLGMTGGLILGSDNQVKTYSAVSTGDLSNQLQNYVLNTTYTSGLNTKANLSGANFTGAISAPSATLNNLTLNLNSTGTLQIDSSGIVSTYDAVSALNLDQKLQDYVLNTTYTSGLNTKANLSGASFTGAITGTSANFNSLNLNLSATGTMIIGSDGNVSTYEAVSVDNLTSELENYVTKDTYNTDLPKKADLTGCTFTGDVNVDTNIKTKSFQVTSFTGPVQLDLSGNLIPADFVTPSSLSNTLNNYVSNTVYIPAINAKADIINPEFTDSIIVDKNIQSDSANFNSLRINNMTGPIQLDRSGNVIKASFVTPTYLNAQLANYATSGSVTTGLALKSDVLNPTFTGNVTVPSLIMPGYDSSFLYASPSGLITQKPKISLSDFDASVYSTMTGAPGKLVQYDSNGSIWTNLTTSTGSPGDKFNIAVDYQGKIILDADTHLINTDEIADNSITFDKLYSEVYSLDPIPGTLVLRDESGGIQADNYFMGSATGASNAILKVDSGIVSYGLVETVNINNGAVGQNQLDYNSVGTDELIDGNVTLAKISNTAYSSSLRVSTLALRDPSGYLAAKNIALSDLAATGSSGQVLLSGGGLIAYGQVQGANIADNAIVYSKIADGNVTNSKLQDKTIDASKIADGVITALQIESGTITKDEIANKTITADLIADETITALQIANGTITKDEIANKTITLNEIDYNTYSSTGAPNTLAQYNASGALYAKGITLTSLKSKSYLSTDESGQIIGSTGANTLTFDDLIITSMTGGVVHVDSNGLLTSSLVQNSDLASVSYSSVPNTLMVRDNLGQAQVSNLYITASQGQSILAGEYQSNFTYSSTGSNNSQNISTLALQNTSTSGIPTFYDLAQLVIDGQIGNGSVDPNAGQITNPTCINLSAVNNGGINDIPLIFDSHYLGTNTNSVGTGTGREHFTIDTNRDKNNQYSLGLRGPWLFQPNSTGVSGEDCFIITGDNPTHIRHYNIPDVKVDADFVMNSSSSGQTIGGTITLSSIGEGIVKSDSDGLLTSSALTIADLPTNIPDSKLATITTAGKVANSATTATTSLTPNAIVLRNSSGYIDGGQLTNINVDRIQCTQCYISNSTNPSNIYIIWGTSPPSATRHYSLVDVGQDANFIMSTGANQIIGGNLSLTDLSTGILHSDSNGLLSSSALTISDLPTNIPDSNLATISTSGKVANSATTATFLSSSNSIVLRGSNGDIAGRLLCALGSGSNYAQIAASSSLSNSVTYTIPNSTIATSFIIKDATTAQSISSALNVSSLTITSLNSAGIIHTNSSGNLSTSLITDADITSGTITDDKLATISTAGKVSNSATTATSSTTAYSIVSRDQNGESSFGGISISGTGNGLSVQNNTSNTFTTTESNIYAPIASFGALNSSTDNIPTYYNGLNLTVAAYIGNSPANSANGQVGPNSTYVAIGAGNVGGHAPVPLIFPGNYSGTSNSPVLSGAYRERFTIDTATSRNPNISLGIRGNWAFQPSSTGATNDPCFIINGVKPTSNRNYTIPDVGVDTSFLMSNSTSGQTIGGNLSITGEFDAGAVANFRGVHVANYGDLLMVGNGGTITIPKPTLSGSAVYHLPDTELVANFLVSGSKTGQSMTGGFAVDTLKVSSLTSSGVVHNDSSGNLSTSLVQTSDISKNYFQVSILGGNDNEAIKYSTDIISSGSISKTADTIISVPPGIFMVTVAFTYGPPNISANPILLTANIAGTDVSYPISITTSTGGQYNGSFMINPSATSNLFFTTKNTSINAGFLLIHQII